MIGGSPTVHYGGPMFASHVCFTPHTEASPAERVWTVGAWTTALPIDAMELHAFCATHQKKEFQPSYLQVRITP